MISIASNDASEQAADVDQDRLCVALSTWAPFWAGAEVAALRLALGLRYAGHDVVMIVGTDGEALVNYRDAGLRCELVPMATSNKWTFWKTLQMRRQVNQLLLRELPDVIHANDLPTSQMVGAAARDAKVPHICHHRWVFQQAAIDWLNKHDADHHLFVSHYLKNKLCRESALLASKPHAVVYDGLPPLEVSGQMTQQAARTQLDISQEKLIVLLAGQVIERKGIADTLHAWGKLSDTDRQRTELHIVGDDLESKGAYRHKMQRLASHLRVDAHFHGFSRNLPEWLTACDIVLVPSHIEPLGNATLEAMVTAKPVIGTSVGGIPEMVVDNQTGLLVPARCPDLLSKAIKILIDSEEMRRKFGRAGRQRYNELFTIETHVTSMLLQYRKVITSVGAAKR